MNPRNIPAAARERRQPTVEELAGAHRQHTEQETERPLRERGAALRRARCRRNPLYGAQYAALKAHEQTEVKA